MGQWANGSTFMATENPSNQNQWGEEEADSEDSPLCFPGLCRSRASGALWIRLIFPPLQLALIPARFIGWTSADLRPQADDPHIVFPRSGASVLLSGHFFNFPCDDPSMVAGFRWSANSTLLPPPTVVFDRSLESGILPNDVSLSSHYLKLWMFCFASLRVVVNPRWEAVSGDLTTDRSDFAATPFHSTQSRCDGCSWRGSRLVSSPVTIHVHLCPLSFSHAR